LAQRAYRQRKETTISGLNKRVMELEEIIGKMNQAFLTFNDKAIASGIGTWEPQLAQDLKSTTESFIEFARRTERETYGEESEGEGSDRVPNISARVFEEGKPHLTTGLAREGPAVDERVTAPDATVISMLGYAPVPPSINETNLQGPQLETDQAVVVNYPDQSDSVTSGTLRQYQLELPRGNTDLELVSPAIRKEPPLPSSYSFQESSFARRLMRTALESAYRLLKNPNTQPEAIARFCRFTFMWTNRQSCIKWLEIILSRTSHESLEYWGAPLLHIGGAGLHYPRTGLESSSSPPPGWEAPAPLGPLPFLGPATPYEESTGSGNVANIAEAAGFDGEWFDSNDVEQYLRTKGLFLDAHSSYVELDADLDVEVPSEANVPMMGSPTESYPDSNGHPRSPASRDPILVDGPSLDESAMMWSEAFSMTPSFDGMEMGSLFEPSHPSEPKEPGHPGYLGSVAPTFITPPHRSIRRKYIDVEKFILSLSPFPPLPRPFPTACMTDGMSRYAAYGGMSGSHAWIPEECS
jgi:hypothetical protein